MFSIYDTCMGDSINSCISIGTKISPEPPDIVACSCRDLKDELSSKCSGEIFKTQVEV